MESTLTNTKVEMDRKFSIKGSESATKVMQMPTVSIVSPENMYPIQNFADTPPRSPVRTPLQRRGLSSSTKLLLSAVSTPKSQLRSGRSSYSQYSINDSVCDGIELLRDQLSQSQCSIFELEKKVVLLETENEELKALRSSDAKLFHEASALIVSLENDRIRLQHKVKELLEDPPEIHRLTMASSSSDIDEVTADENHCQCSPNKDLLDRLSAVCSNTTASVSTLCQPHAHELPVHRIVASGCHDRENAFSIVVRSPDELSSQDPAAITPMVESYTTVVANMPQQALNATTTESELLKQKISELESELRSATTDIFTSRALQDLSSAKLEAEQALECSQRRLLQAEQRIEMLTRMCTSQSEQPSVSLAMPTFENNASESIEKVIVKELQTQVQTMEVTNMQLSSKIKLLEGKMVDQKKAIDSAEFEYLTIKEELKHWIQDSVPKVEHDKEICSFQIKIKALSENMEMLTSELEANSTSRQSLQEMLENEMRAHQFGLQQMKDSNATLAALCDQLAGEKKDALSQFEQLKAEYNTMIVSLKETEKRSAEYETIKEQYNQQLNILVQTNKELALSSAQQVQLSTELEKTSNQLSSVEKALEIATAAASSDRLASEQREKKHSHDLQQIKVALKKSQQSVVELTNELEKVKLQFASEKMNWDIANAAATEKSVALEHNLVLKSEEIQRLIVDLEQTKEINSDLLQRAASASNESVLTQQAIVQLKDEKEVIVQDAKHKREQLMLQIERLQQDQQSEINRIKSALIEVLASREQLQLQIQQLQQEQQLEIERVRNASIAELEACKQQHEKIARRMEAEQTKQLLDIQLLTASNNQLIEKLTSNEEREKLCSEGYAAQHRVHEQKIEDVQRELSVLEVEHAEVVQQMRETCSQLLLSQQTELEQNGVIARLNSEVGTLFQKNSELLQQLEESNHQLNESRELLQHQIDLKSEECQKLTTDIEQLEEANVSLLQRIDSATDDLTLTRRLVQELQDEKELISRRAKQESEQLLLRIERIQQEQQLEIECVKDDWLAKLKVCEQQREQIVQLMEAEQTKQNLNLQSLREENSKLVAVQVEQNEIITRMIGENNAFADASREVCLQLEQKNQLSIEHISALQQETIELNKRNSDIADRNKELQLKLLNVYNDQKAIDNRIESISIQYEKMMADLREEIQCLIARENNNNVVSRNTITEYELKCLSLQEENRQLAKQSEERHLVSTETIERLSRTTAELTSELHQKVLSVQMFSDGFNKSNKEYQILQTANTQLQRELSDLKDRKDSEIDSLVKELINSKMRLAAYDEEVLRLKRLQSKRSTMTY